MEESSTKTIAAHTPGPWYVNGYAYKRDDSAPAGRRVYLCGSDSDLCEGYTINAENSQVCELRRHSRKADARLIAAAPDLLKAVEAIQRDCIEVLQGREPLRMALIHAIANGRARAAIAKARGQ